MPNYQCHKHNCIGYTTGCFSIRSFRLRYLHNWFTPCFQNHGHRHDRTKLACKLLPVKRNPILCKEQRSPPYINAKLNEPGQIGSLKLIIASGKPEIGSYSLKYPKTPCEKKDKALIPKTQQCENPEQKNINRQGFWTAGAGNKDPSCSVFWSKHGDHRSRIQATVVLIT